MHPCMNLCIPPLFDLSALQLLDIGARASQVVIGSPKRILQKLLQHALLVVGSTGPLWLRTKQSP